MEKRGRGGTVRCTRSDLQQFETDAQRRTATKNPASKTALSAPFKERPGFAIPMKIVHHILFFVFCLDPVHGGAQG